MTRWVSYRSTPADFPNAVQDSIGFGTLDGDWVQPYQGDIFQAPVPTGQALALASLDLLSPVRPRQFIGLWNNFHAAAAKGGPAATHPAKPV